MKRFLKFLLFIILLAVAAVAGFFFIEVDGETHNPMDLIPKDFVYAIESDRPTGDWQDLSSSAVWQYIKGNEFFADITEMADYGDSLLSANQTLVDFVKLGDLYVSIHMTKNNQDYDFLFLVDLKGKGRKLAKLKPLTEALFEELGYEVTSKQKYNYDYYQLKDPSTKDVLTLATIKNVLAVSYTDQLVFDAIIQSEEPSILEEPSFKTVRTRTDRDELYTIYINFDIMDNYLGLYTDGDNDMLSGIEEIISYGGLDLNMRDEGIFMDGYLKQIDSVASYLNVYKDAGTGKSHAQNILPQNTAMYTSIGFDDFSDLYARFTAQMMETDPEGYRTLEATQKQMEKRLKIEFDRDFFQWMTDEIVTAVIPTGIGNNYSYYAMMHYDDHELVEERMEHVMKRIGKTLVKFEEYDYQGFKIRYLKMKGFFNLFFKKMFNKIEKPYFTYIDDYVVFSNDTTALIHLIDQYLTENVLKNDESYEDFRDQFSSSFSVFTYIQNEHFYHYMMSSLDAESQRDLIKNREYIMSFPQLGFLLKPDGELYESSLKAEFIHPDNKPLVN